MRKKFMLFVFCLTIGLSACAGASTDKQTIQNEEKTAEGTSDEDGESLKNEKESNDSSENGGENGIQSHETEQNAVIYSIDDNGEVVSHKVAVSELNEKTIWEELKKMGSVPQSSEVISLVMDENKQMELDVNQAFGDALREQGTAGEKEMIQCVVNTYLDSYGYDKIRIVEEGDILISGHKEYADFMQKIID